ncbi:MULTISPECIES: ABC transporter ATP-binding protein [unclassified Arthrobacter]|uniref:ABC transporter ATP-binding protein n=1 Tax=unclassified Arthrobacter TaxID=235627 RepID=UPI001CFFB8DD|nr:MULTISPECIES: ABC transporter ATP-binding protein [unclassified Arthrobacter]MCB5283065.1 Daunorubicin/doxorubicin resistance ATP-binding protein DrrA [Arthrobacter sp. ES1]WGZ79320.1 ABC transporter ATP-binding protein [Arthrobacter sp. EM1]
MEAAQAQIRDVLDVSGLVKRYGELTAVGGVSFHIGAGETFGLLGPNGAGKTTIISMVAGLIAANEGTVRVAGQEMDPARTEAKRNIGLVPQELAIYPDLTARENLKFFGRLQGLTGSRLTQRSNEVLELIGLADRAGDQTKKYSGGMKRRLNIGIGLLHRPTLLILDEPTVGVDPQSRNAILESVEKLSVDGMAVLYTTHYMEEAERLCDRIAIIDEGRIQAEGTREQLITLTGGVDRINLRGDGSMARAAEVLRELPAVQHVDNDGAGLMLTVSDGPTALAGIVTGAASAGMSVTSVEIVRPDLESVFLHLTGKALRD